MWNAMDRCVTTRSCADYAPRLLGLQVNEKTGTVRVLHLCNLYKHVKRVDLGPDRVKWAAPELVMSPREAQHNSASDAYSFGTLLWSLASCKEPYESVDPATLADLVVSQNYRYGNSECRWWYVAVVVSDDDCKSCARAHTHTHTDYQFPVILQQHLPN
jgi:hypothetical protein